METPRFTERELDIMSVLWREGSGSVAATSLSSRRRLPEEAPSTASGRNFGGSAEHLLAQLIADHDIPAEELARMRKILEELEEE
jgi:predicted transcriptional regulator